jgi:hypothetical protein
MSLRLEFLLGSVVHPPSQARPGYRDLRSTKLTDFLILDHQAHAVRDSYLALRDRFPLAALY